jgi:hypothetical protein
MQEMRAKMGMLKDLHKYSDENIQLETDARQQKDNHHSEMIQDLWFGYSADSADTKKYLAQAFGEILKLTNKTDKLESKFEKAEATIDDKIDELHTKVGQLHETIDNANEHFAQL